MRPRARRIRRAILRPRGQPRRLCRPLRRARPRTTLRATRARTPRPPPRELARAVGGRVRVMRARRDSSWPARLPVVDFGLRTQFRGLLFGRGVGEEVAAADLWACEVLQEVGLSERRVELDVEVEAPIVAAVGGGLVQRDDVWEGHRAGDD